MKLSKTKNIDACRKQDGKILSRLRKKDKEAFIKAYDLYVDHIYRFIYFKVSNKEDAQDLVSAVFLKTWNYIQRESLKDVKTLRALLYKVSRTSIIDHYRKNSQHNNIRIDDQENEIDIADDRQNIAEKTEIIFDFRIIENKLKELKDEYREVIILRFIDELSIDEIAEIVGKTKGNVRVLLYRSLKALKELIGDKKL